MLRSTSTSSVSKSSGVNNNRKKVLNTVGNYHMVRILGKGNFARVAEAVHTVLQSKVFLSSIYNVTYKVIFLSRPFDHLCPFFCRCCRPGILRFILCVFFNIFFSSFFWEWKFVIPETIKLIEPQLLQNYFAIFAIPLKCFTTRTSYVDYIYFSLFFFVAWKKNMLTTCLWKLRCIVIFLFIFV